MRSLACAVVAAAALVVGLAAPAGAMRSDPPAGYVCKVLRTAIQGRAIGHYAKHLGGSNSTGCRYDGGPDGTPWDVELSLDNDVTAAGGPRGYARLFCKPFVTNGSGKWLTKARTGANVACAYQLEDNVRVTTHAFFAKGRWYGELILFVPPSGVGLTTITQLVKEVTTQLR